MTIRDHLQPSPSEIDGENMAVAGTEGFHADGTEIRRKVPLKKRKREYGEYTRPEGSSSHDETAQSHSRDPSDRGSSSQPSSGAPSPATLPEQYYNPAAAPHGSDPIGRVPVKKRPSFQEERQEKPIGKQAMENGSMDEDFYSGDSASCSVSVVDSDDEKLPKSPDPEARIDFFKKRGRKLPKALRKLASEMSKGKRLEKNGENSAGSTSTLPVPSFANENRVDTKKSSLSNYLPPRERNDDQTQQSDYRKSQAIMKSTNGSKSSEFALQSKPKKKKGLLPKKEKHSTERTRLVSRDTEVLPLSQQDTLVPIKKEYSEGSNPGAAAYPQNNSVADRNTEYTRISREPSDSDHGEDPKERAEDSRGFRGVKIKAEFTSYEEEIQVEPSNVHKSAETGTAQGEGDRAESNLRVSKKKKKKHRSSEGSEYLPVSNSKSSSIPSHSTPVPKEKTQPKETPKAERQTDFIPKASSSNNSPADDLSDSDDSDSDEEQNFWIQCDACKKWRIIPAHMSGWLPDIWHCDENLWDPKRASCSVPQQELEEDEYHIGGHKKGTKKKKKGDKKPEKEARPDALKSADGVQKRPRGRPPLGKVWDCAKGMYVPKDKLSVEAQSLAAASAASSPNAASFKSDKNVQKSSEKKGKKKSSDSLSAKRKKVSSSDGVGSTLADYSTRDQKQLEKLLAIGKREAKAELVREKERVMKRLPQSVKNLFGQVGFARWGAQCLPALCLDPYKVPPGAAREAWMNMFKNVRKSGPVLNDINILVHWYGEQHPDNLFSLLEIDKFIPYHESTHEMRCYDKAAKKKLKLQKKLTRHDQQRIRAMDELHLDLQKRPAERQPVEFKERDELLTIADVVEYLDEESDASESESVAPKQHANDGGYSTLEDSEDDLETEPNTPAKSIVKKKAPPSEKRSAASDSKEVARIHKPNVPNFDSDRAELPSYSRSKGNVQSHSEQNEHKKSNRVSPFQSSPIQSSPESRPAGWGGSAPKVATQDAQGLPVSPKSLKFKKAKAGKKGDIDSSHTIKASLDNPVVVPNAAASQSATERDLTAVEGLPDDSELDNMRVDDLVQRIFMQAKGRAEGSALMGTVVHVVNRLREQRDAALQQVAALSVERANLLAVLQGGEVKLASKKKPNLD